MAVVISGQGWLRRSSAIAGEESPARIRRAGDRVRHNVHAGVSNQVWPSDITEEQHGTGKVVSVCDQGRLPMEDLRLCGRRGVKSSLAVRGSGGTVSRCRRERRQVTRTSCDHESFTPFRTNPLLPWCLAWDSWTVPRGTPRVLRDECGDQALKESWEDAVNACRQARLHHEAFTVAAKEVELEAIAQLMELGFGVREISRLTKVPRSTTSRLMRDLEAARQQVAIERVEVDPSLLAHARNTIGAEFDTD